MRNIILAAVAAVGLSGCTGFGGGYGSGVSVGVRQRLRQLRLQAAMARQQLHRLRQLRPACFTGRRGGYYGATATRTHAAGMAVYHYPGYTYRQGYMYDRYTGRRISARTLTGAITPLQLGGSLLSGGSAGIARVWAHWNPAE